MKGRIQDELQHIGRLPKSELRGYWAVTRSMSREKMRWFFHGDRPKGYTLLGQALANYASNLSCVHTCTANGDKTGASIYKTCVDICRERLNDF